MRFKSTQNIFKDFAEVFESKWMDSNVMGMPPKTDWDYSRELQIEDVDIWEVIYEQGGGVGVYASWSPYAEFYMIRTGWWNDTKGYGIETYYGPQAQQKVQERMKDLHIPFTLNQVWVDPEEMWLYENKPMTNDVLSLKGLLTPIPN
jgi:hypothetical protein